MGGVQSTPDSDSLDGRRASSTASSSCFLLPRPLSSTNRVPILTASSCDDSILKLLEEVVVLAEEEDGDEVDRNDEHRTDSTDSLQDEDISSTAQHLPFRKCTRRKCSCCTPSTLPSGRIRKRLDSEDFTTLRWMPKSHSERNHSQALTYLKRTSFSEEYFVSQNEITPRSISEDSSDSSKELRMPPSASDAPLRARETSESLCDDVPSSSTARLDLPYQSNYSRLSHPNRNSQDDWCIGVDGKRDCHQKELQSRSEDYADSSITRCSLPTSHIPQVRKLRSDSIDIFAEEGYKKPLSSNCHKNRLSFLSKSFSECSLKADDSSEPFKQRSRSEDITNLRDDCSQEKVIRRCQSSTSAGKSRKILDSPTSVIHLEYPPQDIPTAANSSNNRSLLQFYRNAVQVLKEKHRHDKVGLASLYHKIGLIHHQESRYSAASCVFNHALELLSFASGCWLLEDALPFMGPEEVTLSVNLLLSRARLEHSMGNREEAKRSAKLALQAIPSLQEHSLLLAEGLVALAQTYQEDKPERAMKHFQQALDILRCRLGDNHVGVALVMYHIGNLHAQFESFDLAQLF